MKKPFIIVVLMILPGMLFAQSSITPFYEFSKPLPAAPGAIDIAYSSMVNPALLTTVQNFCTMFTCTALPGNLINFNTAGIVFALPNTGSGLFFSKQADDSWQIRLRSATALGNRFFSIGFGTEWNTTNASPFAATNILTLGLLLRPSPFLSLGLAGNVTCDFREQELGAELSLRPLGGDSITLFADYALLNPRGWNDFAEGDYSIGTVLKLPFVKGISFTGRWFPRSQNFAVGTKIGVNGIGAVVQGIIPGDLSTVTGTYGVEFSPGEESSLEDVTEKGSYYLEIPLTGTIDYRSPFPVNLPGLPGGHSLINLLETIRKAKEDTTVAGIVLHTSGITVNRELLWELRESLALFRASGKHIIITLDNAGIDLYYFASIADRILLDSLGMIELKGYMAGGSYYKTLLAKAGIGFEEFRLYTHKSAYETFSMDKMSIANREQLDDIIKDFYTIVRKEICNARGFSEETFDALVNQGFIFHPGAALEQKIVDSIGRKDKVPALIMELEGEYKQLIAPADLKENTRTFARAWGEPEEVALIYALGICAMDTGIRGRALANVIRSVAMNPSIRAVVIRVDSPGGDAVASDYVAEAILECKKHKPVVISQGAVAGSGGYWLSMYGDAIVTAPFTLTGSIGVASSWIYNAGLKENLGISTDVIKQGEHADYDFPFTLPLTGIGLPDRNMTLDEQEKIKALMQYCYKEFINKAAEGRKKTAAAIEAIAQGRLWTGSRAVELGLADQIGNLEKAVGIAKELAGIPAADPISIVELPVQGMFDQLAPYLQLLGIQAGNDPGLPFTAALNSYMEFLLTHNGKALPVISLEELELIPGL